ncbi:GTP-binding protein [Lachnoclostridium sp. Marseille-P6806]|uniref:GTP-binding protein n=1 Tax=Lachnoclostridium sp. Marseille-P6806 TaxID=2364793 RepID=UPI001F5ED9D0|nr:GTP-binding protein [Lachnoclostridium sp. Marseille-P6806]
MITGYLGSGKTTFLNELLRQEKRKIALVVNDMGSINVDARLLREKAAMQMDSGVIGLSNGCICCTLPEEDRQEVFDNYPEVSGDWDDTYGDRMNQIVFIGKHLDREAVSARLVRCAAHIS